MLTETDGPYLKIGTRSAKPSDVFTVLEYLAHVWGISTNEADYQVSGNFQELMASIRADL